MFQNTSPFLSRPDKLTIALLAWPRSVTGPGATLGAGAIAGPCVMAIVTASELSLS